MINKRGPYSRGWDKVEPEILVEIFTLLNVMDLITSIPRVCRSWLSVCQDPRVWETMDLSVLTCERFENPQVPYAWSDGKSKDRLLHILNAVSRISSNNMMNLYFNFYIRLKDEHLALAADRFPNMRRVVLASYNNITHGGLVYAAQRWRNLESLTLTAITHSASVMMIIGENCKNFSKLRLTSPFSIELATAITTYLPPLKCLSIRCTVVQKEALNILLNRQKGLEVLNLSHCVFMETLRSSFENFFFYRKLETSIVRKTSKIKTVLMCNNINDKNDCLICQRLSKGEFEYREHVWHEDEVTDLA